MLNILRQAGRSWFGRNDDTPSAGVAEADEPIPEPFAPSSPQPRLVGFGHSHLQAIKEAHLVRCDIDPEQEGRVEFVQLLDPAFVPVLNENGEPGANLLSALRQTRSDTMQAPPLLFCCISGNEHQFLGLVNHPRRFDFVLPDRPDLPLSDDAEIIPMDLMTLTMKTYLADAFTILKGMAQALPGGFVQVQSPPPVGDNAFVEQHPIQFAADIARHGVSPPSLRLKLWLLQSELFRKECGTLGVSYLPVPAGVTDPAGFLVPQALQPDPVHANRWYGEHVLQQLDALALAA